MEQNYVTVILRTLRRIDVKKIFTFFILVTFFTFFNVFYFPNIFYLRKRWQSSERQQVNKKHFQNNSNETDL